MKLTQEYLQIIAKALEEDIGTGDITTKATVGSDILAQAQVIFKEAGIVAGLPFFKGVFANLCKDVVCNSFVAEGQYVPSGEIVLEVRGRADVLLQGERTALNFLQRLSGIASFTHVFVKAVENTKIKILDTRKTTPTLRNMEKYAVKIAGGTNYRQGLYDAIMVKDNHIKIAGGISKAVAKVLAMYKRRYPIIVEASNLEQVKEACVLEIDRVMLDNMDIETTKKAIEVIAGRVEIEVSGGMTPEKTRELSRLEIDYISAGSLTNRASSLDISMNMTTNEQVALCSS